jgi:hypothetical protein
MITDAALVQRLETSAARVIARTAAALDARVEPWLGGVLVALGPGMYVNRAVGVGTAEPTTADLDALEAFFRSADVPPSVEVSSWASTAMVRQLGHRQYRPDWFRNVYARAVGPVAGDAPGDVRDKVPGDEHGIVIRRLGENDRDGQDARLVDQWLDTLTAGNGVGEPGARRISDDFARARASVEQSVTLVAFVDGAPAGCGSLEVDAGIGWVGGAATVPTCRNRGVQVSLLRERARLAVTMGCDLLAGTALPAGASARNLLRQRFELVYSQVVMTGVR